ncbi:hypothetical protein BDV18DRAFT_132842 [Aspergillus unguis]
MKFAILLFPSLAFSWTFTWRTSSGDENTEHGTGPSKCISVNHAKGQEFELDGEGEENINMLLFDNSDCEGDPAGMATVSFKKESSVDIKGFQVVSLDGDGEEETSTSTTTTSDLNQTVTLPTVPATTNGTATSISAGSSTGSSTDETQSPTSTPDETLSPTPTATETDTETETKSPTSSTETSSDSGNPTDPTAGSSDDPAPTGGSVMLGVSGLTGAVIAGGWVVDLLF